MKYRLLVLSLLLVATTLSCAGKKRSHVYETFEVVFDGRPWTKVFEDQMGKDTIAQYVPNGSTRENWTEMLTERSFPGLQATSSAKQEMDNARALAETQCKKVEWQVADQAIGSISYAAAIGDCEETRPPHELGRFIISSRAIYLVQYQTTRAPSAEQKNSWLAVLGQSHYTDHID